MLSANDLKAGYTYQGRDGARRKVVEVAGSMLRYEPDGDFVLMPIICERVGFAMWAKAVVDQGPRPFNI